MTFDRARYEAARLLFRCTDEKGYSNILVRTALPDALSGKDRDFCVFLFYGTLERLYFIDVSLSACLSRPLSSLDKEVRATLRTAAFQILCCDTIPDSAAVNEAVPVVRAMKKTSAAGFVNGVLRTLCRKKESILKDLPDDLRLSCPPEMIEELHRERGADGIRFLENTLGGAPVFIRVNTLKTTDAALGEMLAEAGVTLLPTTLAHCFEARGLGDLQMLPAHKEGFFHVEDLSAQLCAHALLVTPGMRVLDLCSAPGGKTFTLAEEMGNTGEVLACDLHENRLRAVASGAERLGLSNIDTAAGDAREYKAEYGLFDRVLCDVPCSGLGVIRRRPELKLKPAVEFLGLPEVQLAILANAAKYVKKNGLLLYCTCTLRKSEDEQVVTAFLKENRAFQPIPMDLPFPGADTGMAALIKEEYNGDGFFAALLRRVEV